MQARCIPLVLQGKDVLARAPTGTGKTYAYSIPLLQKVLARQDLTLTLTLTLPLTLTPTPDPYP